MNEWKPLLNLWNYLKIYIKGKKGKTKENEKKIMVSYTHHERKKERIYLKNSKSKTY